jgi:hypothetical protein
MSIDLEQELKSEKNKMPNDFLKKGEHRGGKEIC